jgi:hypothetical protein
MARTQSSSRWQDLSSAVGVAAPGATGDDGAAAGGGGAGDGAPGDAGEDVSAHPLERAAARPTERRRTRVREQFMDRPYHTALRHRRACRTCWETRSRLMRVRPLTTVLLIPVLTTLIAGGGPRLARADEEAPPPRRPLPTRVKPYTKDVCEVADTNIKRTLEAVLAARTPSGPPPSAVATGGAGAPAASGRLEGLDLIERRFHLRPAERALLRRQGLVVLDRLAFGNPALAYHEIYQSQVPIYISVDSIFHALFASHDGLLADLESKQLLPRLERVLSRLSDALPAAAGSGGGAASYPDDVAADLDLYLAVSRALLSGNAPTARLPRTAGSTVAQATSLVAQARAASALSMVELFGRARMVDFTVYAPRGHYTRTPELTRFFLAATWLSRLELNLVSRSSRSSAPGIVPDPRETPREAMLALALADLVERAGVAAEVASLDRAWAVLAGHREDLSPAELTRLRQTARIAQLRDAGAFDRLKAAIGDRYQRTARTHYMPQGSTVLPAIATFLGPRIVADSAATRPLVHADLPDRYNLGAADIAFALGQDRALAYLANDLRAHRGLKEALGKARGIAHRTPVGPDLYSLWLDAIRRLARKPAGVRPSYMATRAFADLRLNSTVAAFGQLRHNHVLVAAASYDEGGCAIPDGYVEPAPEVYRALAAYARAGIRSMAELDPKDALGGIGYFKRVGSILRALEAIARAELSGQPLSADARRFLSMVVEISDMGRGTGDPPTYTGWYFDLFRVREEGLKSASFLADYYTSTNLPGIAYVGVYGMRLGVFVIDVGGPPRVVIGPVTSAFQHLGPLSRRLSDDDVHKISRSAPWAKSYTAPAPAVPAAVRVNGSASAVSKGQLTLKVSALRPVARMTLELLDHHRQVIGTATRPLPAGETAVVIPLKKLKPKRGEGAASPDREEYPSVDAVRLAIGEYQEWAFVPWISPEVSLEIGDWPATKP